jgi:hypothetical protein
MKCDHCGVKRFVCLMYNCTDLNISVSSFKKSLINDVNLLKPSRYYSYGCRVLNVLHTRLRHRSSNLNADLFRVNLIKFSFRSKGNKQSHKYEGALLFRIL